MSLERDASIGSQAKGILDAQVFQDAVNKVQQGVFDAFAAVDPKDLPGLQEQRIKLKCLADIVRELTTVMNTGKLAQAEIDHDKSLAKRVADPVIRMVRSVF